MGHPEYMGETHLGGLKDGRKSGGKAGSGSDVKCSGIQSKGRELELSGLQVRQRAGWSSH